MFLKFIQGSQLFTGSFHPVTDGDWADSKGWDKRATPDNISTLGDLFHYR